MNDTNNERDKLFPAFELTDQIGTLAAKKGRLEYFQGTRWFFLRKLFGNDIAYCTDIPV